MSIQEIFEKCKAMNPGDEQPFSLGRLTMPNDPIELRALLENEYGAGQKQFSVARLERAVYVWCIRPIYGGPEISTPKGD